MNPEFLTVDDVMEIHELQVSRFGGGVGLRDLGLLEAAVAQPQMEFAGEFLHSDLFAMAGAYLFHLVSNHAFVDGNKRVGLAAALVFLDLNGIAITRGTDALYILTMEVAQGLVPKAQVALRLREIAET